MKRVTLAFLLAPFPAALIQSIVVALWPKEGRGVFAHPLSMFVTICLLFYLVELVVALPLYIAVRKRIPQSMSSYGLSGALMVLLPIAVGLGVSVVRDGLSTYAVIYDLAFFAIGGFLAGMVFWHVTRPQSAAS